MISLEQSNEPFKSIKVRFRKPICEDDFPESGMVAWLTGIEVSPETQCYKLYFDFSEFEEENLKYFREEYFPNSITAKLPVQKQLWTAIEAGMYSPKYSVYFGDITVRTKWGDNDINTFLEVVEDEPIPCHSEGSDVLFSGTYILAYPNGKYQPMPWMRVQKTGPVTRDVIYTVRDELAEEMKSRHGEMFCSLSVDNFVRCEE